MTLQIRTETVIRARRETIWNILTDLGSYGEWNPFIVESNGTISRGNTIRNTMKNGSGTITFSPTIIHVDSGVSFTWLGSLWIKSIFDGEHYFEIEELPDGACNLIHGERFSGLLSRLIFRAIGNQTRENFVAMNTALKQRAEAMEK